MISFTIFYMRKLCFSSSCHSIHLYGFDLMVLLLLLLPVLFVNENLWNKRKKTLLIGFGVFAKHSHSLNREVNGKLSERQTVKIENVQEGKRVRQKWHGHGKYLSIYICALLVRTFSTHLSHHRFSLSFSIYVDETDTERERDRG